MKLVVIESPYAGDVEKNLAYMRVAMCDSLARGEAPFASHALYTQVLRDENPKERELGMQAGFAWGRVAELTAVYLDLGITAGMLRGIDRAIEAGRPVEYRSIPGLSGE